MSAFTKAFAHAQIKDMDVKDGKLRIKGVASTGSVDRMNEIVDQESLKNAIHTHTTKSLFYMHSWDSIIGKVLEWIPEKETLGVVAEIGSDFNFPYKMKTLSVDDIAKQIQDGYLKALSIGFMAKREAPDEDEEGNPKAGPTKLIVKQLLELSVVGIPANADCTFDMVKAMKGISGMDGDEKFTTDLFTRSLTRFSLDNEEVLDEVADELTESELRIANEILVNMKSLRGLVSQG